MVYLYYQVKEIGGQHKMIVGYVRVSSVDQNEARQMVTMEKYQAEKVYSEKSCTTTVSPSLT